MPVPSFSVGEVLTAGAMNQVGLWKIAEGTTATGTSADINDIFSADYQRYLVQIDNVTVSTTTDIRMRLRNSSGTLQSAIYYMNNLFLLTNASQVNTENTQTSFRGLYTGNSAYNYWKMDIIDPFAADATVVLCSSQGWDGSRVTWRSFAGFVDDNVSYTGMTLFTGSTPTFSAHYTIYGYRN